MKAIVRLKNGDKMTYVLTGIDTVERAFEFIKAEIPEAISIWVRVK